MKGKQLFALVLVCLLAIFCCGCKTDEEKAAEQAQANWNQASNEQRVSIYCALVKEYMILVERLGEDTPYPAMKRSVKGSMMSDGLTQDEAIEKAKKYLLEEQAVFWRAEQDGVKISDSSLKSYIQQNIISKVAQEEDYITVSKACEKEGITFEDTIWAYKDSYKVDCIKDTVGIKSPEQMEEYKKAALERFKESEEYRDYQEVLETCADLIRKNITNQEDLKEADIYYE